MDFKTVAKSKSSNRAIAPKAEIKKSKKCLSNAAFQPSIVKKRGVYVETKLESSTNTQEANDIQIQKKPPRRPRPGQKKFLASVLTILSKSTAATQYPDEQEDSTKEKTQLMPKHKTANDTESKLVPKTTKTKKGKYRSRVLNDEKLKSEKEQLIILQPKKEIAQTPSNSSVKVKTANNSIKFADENESKRSTIRDILENTIYSGVAEGVSKEVLEEKPKKVKKLRINDDPETIASEVAKADDKNMYNFFVDLLETTISVYNVKTDYEMSDVSKTAFEIDDAVVKKLEISKNHNSVHEKINYKPKRDSEHSIIEKENFNVTENLSIDVKPSEYRSSTTKKPKIKAKSFLNPRNLINTRKAKSTPKSKSFEDSKNRRKRNKKQILNHLKEELAKDTFSYNEPENLFDALKVMAKNKRKSEKSIHFVNKIDNRDNNLDFECMFERRKILSFGSRKNKVKQNKIPISESRNSHKSDDYSTSFFPSSHSLQVYGFDYEEPAKALEGTREKTIVFNYHSSPSNSGSNLGDTLVNYTHTGSSGSNCFEYNKYS